eukprot:TRINITY_DN27922_c0_g1_i13.p2 TRINITY_DN27922_c0_g1~~TRINITY_DN27922_c0_g1_i13.p2  ORF type:complete len:273 (-),score=26.57 TRINITY_DN27922_c0_g1_i13:226-1044(-)
MYKYSLHRPCYYVQSPYGCNAWSYCTKEDGCGEGCSNYIKQWKTAINKGDSDWQNKYAPEQWTDESRQMDGQCGDKWSYKTCTLKRLDKNNVMEIKEGKAADGWVSGVVEQVEYPGWMCQYDIKPGCCGPPKEPDYECADSWCGAVKANLVGAKLLSLDANKGYYTKYGGRLGDTPDSCCAECRENPECDAWTYCNRQEGCGNGCQKTVETLNVGLLGTSNMLSPNSICTDSGAYVFRLCSLKKVADSDYSLVPQEGDKDQGWVSGVLIPYN